MRQSLHHPPLIVHIFIHAVLYLPYVYKYIDIGELIYTTLLTHIIVPSMHLYMLYIPIYTSLRPSVAPQALPLGCFLYIPAYILTYLYSIYAYLYMAYMWYMMRCMHLS